MAGSPSHGCRVVVVSAIEISADGERLALPRLSPKGVLRPYVSNSDERRREESLAQALSPRCLRGIITSPRGNDFRLDMVVRVS